MRCKACDKAMTDVETCRKDPNGGYMELCGECFSVHRTTMDELEGTPTTRLVKDEAR